MESIESLESVEFAESVGNPPRSDCLAPARSRSLLRRLRRNAGNLFLPARLSSSEMRAAGYAVVASLAVHTALIVWATWSADAKVGHLTVPTGERAGRTSDRAPELGSQPSSSSPPDDAIEVSFVPIAVLESVAPAAPAPSSAMPAVQAANPSNPARPARSGARSADAASPRGQAPEPEASGELALSAEAASAPSTSGMPAVAASGMPAVSAEAAPVGPATGKPRPRSPLAMRLPELSLPQRMIDVIAREVPPPSLPAPPASPDEGQELRSAIAALDLKLATPMHRRLASAEQLDAEDEELERKRRDLAQMTIMPAGRGTYRSDQDTFTATIDRDGKAHLKDAPPIKFQGLGLRFDITDALMRATTGADPYARKKMRFLDRTREQRAEIGRLDRTERLSHSVERMRENIDRVWAMRKDPAARREALFELWDDCAEAGEDELVAGGSSARTFVMAVIHARVAYTDGELEALNRRRRSTARFEP